MKKTSTKVLAILLCLATLVSSMVIFSSCGDKEKMTVVVEDGETSYKIIRPDSASREIVELATSLRTAISEKCGCDIDIGTDWVKKEEDIDPNANEILIGMTNRPETKEVIESLDPNNWAVVNKGNKIVVCANNDAILDLAVNWFIENCINAEKKTVKVPEKLVKTEGYGDGMPISIGGVSGFQIVYPKGNKTLEYYASLIQRKTKINNKKINIVPDNRGEAINEIVIGNANRDGVAAPTGEHEYSIATSGSKVFINASDEDTLYYAVNYYIEYVLTVSDTLVSSPSDYQKTDSLKDYYKSSWEINLPYIEEGTIARAYNIGPGLADDRQEDTLTDSYMHVVYNATREMFENYAKRLESFGFKKNYSANTEDNELWGFRLGAAYAYVHYSPREGHIRVIWDKSSNCEVSDIEYVEQQTGVTTFYQYCIDLMGCELVFVDDAKGWGMFYIIKLQDNSLIFVDGGDNPSWTNNSMKGLTDFLYEITGTDKKTPLNIKLWYFTHPDDDHNGLTQPWINYLKSHGYKAPNIENVAFNYGSQRAREGYGKSSTSYQMINYINTNYPNVNYIKLHTGMVLNIGEVKMEVLGTIENMIGKTGVLASNYDTNDTCALVRFEIGGKKFFMCGDTANNASVQDLHLKLYSDTYFKSDVNQIAHHGLNILPKLNKAIGAEYAVVSNGYEGLRTTHLVFATMFATSKIHYAGNYTTAFEISNGTMTVKKIPRYDHPTGILDPNVK